MRESNPFVATGCYTNTDGLLQKLQSLTFSRPLQVQTHAHALSPRVLMSPPRDKRCSEPLPTANVQVSDASCRGKGSKVSTTDKVCVLKGQIRFPDIE